MNQFRARLFFLCSILVLCGAAVVARLFFVQVVERDQYAAQSRNQSQQRCIIPAQRGTIYDRNGRALAASTQQDLSIRADLLGVPAAPATKKKEAWHSRRTYPLSEAEGTVVGCVGKDGNGLGGIEFSFDKYLRGEDGWIILQKDGRNQRCRKVGMPVKQPRPGSDVHLTIDAEVQSIAYTVIRQAVTALGARGGMAIVMDPVTGKILAMTNAPAFDPNCPSRFPLEKRQNACISTIFEPGSTFKVVTAAAALQDNIAREQDIFDGNNGVFEIYHESIRDHERYGKLTFTQALAYSSNVCFAKIATGVGSDRLHRFTQNFGFGSRTGIALPGEECGIVHPIRTWSGRTLVTMGMGQEISVTFLQMMCAYAAVANGGVLVSPQIAEKIVDSDGTVHELAGGKSVRRVMSAEVAGRLGAMLQSVVDSGTGKRAAITDIPVAGKTGTSQKLESGSYSKTQSWASFIGFLPLENPCLLCGVVIDEPANNLMGGSAAAPAFQKLVVQLVSHPELEFAEKVLAAKSVRLCNAGSRSFVRQTAYGEKETAPGSIPYCIGKDARDAVNLVNLLGLTPRVIGSGTVMRQSPPAGFAIGGAEACTLVCAFGG
ncbi:MAG: penicillin-binding transpeptidase domain-containing protein [Chitinispirillaceae bacterium]|nr:penicillin-binding transpeptidase domain-containing protein [Chitinispirillaceae bacterium]